MDDTQMPDAADVAAAAALDTPLSGTYIPPSVHKHALLSGASYTHYSPVPAALLSPSTSTPTPTSDSSHPPPPPPPPPPCCLGVDEAGRGPVLGPMVYGVFYLPLPLSDPLLRETHHFDDSKVLTPAVRSRLMQTLCDPSADQLHTHTGWATTALSAQSIAAGMLKPSAAYNLNAQAMDATIALIKGVLARGVNVREIYVDTIGQPASYQAKLERVFPAISITVAKKADSLYPCVSAASVCAKVTRDACLEVLHEARAEQRPESEGMAWGSGYPSDTRCVNWMRGNMHPVFGWGAECRFSWGTAKDMLEATASKAVRVEWPVEEDTETSRVTDFFTMGDSGRDKDADELGTWFGTPAGLEAF